GGGAGRHRRYDAPVPIAPASQLSATAVRLSRLLADVEVVDRRGDPAGVDVSSVAHDTRKMLPGALFCCLPGRAADGHDHAEAAVAAGAVALVVERVLDVDPAVVQVRVPEARPAMAHIAASLHGHPSRALRVVGVTGTNGKTTTTHLLSSVLEAHGWPTTVIGTLSGRHTTPESPELQRRLAEARDAGRVAVAMEASSHALAQHRCDAVWFAAAVFTNLSQDHLDYHLDMDSYFAAKASLFRPDRTALGVVNADDAWGRRLLDAAPVPMVAWSLDDAEGLRTTTAGCAFVWRGHAVELGLGGRFNAANAVAAATTAAALGVPVATVAAGLSSAPPVPGRFQRVEAGQPFTVVIDYAHTPDALTQVLDEARRLAGDGRVLVVFGCGGDRDPDKRPVMGSTAAALADVAVLTTDNPRHEDPASIIDQVRAGAQGAANLVVEPDRRSAMALALQKARAGDVVVVAGKGHERGQVFADRTEPFDDVEVAFALLSSLEGGGG
ncbi:MAG: UDP-N-acetylmuramoyl-L-alanyl-D-glutamate--2,6-diaminopimelate ligase, partial [Acidimicrobiales bacterium]